MGRYLDHGQLLQLCLCTTPCTARSWAMSEPHWWPDIMVWPETSASSVPHVSLSRLQQCKDCIKINCSQHVELDQCKLATPTISRWRFWADVKFSGCCTLLFNTSLSLQMCSVPSETAWDTLSYRVWKNKEKLALVMSANFQWESSPVMGGHEKPQVEIMPWILFFWLE